jgi:hypothetical protein
MFVLPLEPEEVAIAMAMAMAMATLPPSIPNIFMYASAVNAVHMPKCNPTNAPSYSVVYVTPT